MNFNIGKLCSARILQWINNPKEWCNNHQGRAEVIIAPFVRVAIVYPLKYPSNGCLQYLDSALDWTLYWTMDSQIFGLWSMAFSDFTTPILFYQLHLFLIQDMPHLNNYMHNKRVIKLFRGTDTDDDLDYVANRQ